jgi:hypothetical protein
VKLRRVAEPVLFVGVGSGHPSSDIVMSAVTFGIRSPLGDDQ